jgi:hypothetical protein
MDFRPINSDHAVQSASCNVVFDQPVPAAQLQILRGRLDLLAELPAVQTPDSFEFQVGQGQVARPQRLAGLQMSHLRPDGTPAWALRVVGAQLGVDCNRYTRWDRVWSTVKKYLSAGFEAAASRQVAAVGFVVADAFIANREEYELTSLFRPGPLLAGRIFSAGPTWHNHLGWFASSPSFLADSHWLNQLNIDAFRLGPDNLRIQITHNQELRLDSAIDIPTERDLDKWFAELHLNNKHVLSSLLQPSVSQQIGLAT